MHISKIISFMWSGAMFFVRCPSCCAQIPETVSFCSKCGKPKPRSGWEKSCNLLWNFAVGTFMFVIVANIFMSVYTP